MAGFSSIIGGIGIGLTGYGMFSGMDAAGDMAAAQQQMIQIEMQQEAERKKMMELDARRRRLEMLRQSQRARATALTNATAQGAQFGSGLQGGYGQISGETNSQLLALGQNLEIGRNIFDLNEQLSYAKMAYASAQSDMMTSQAISGLGGSLISMLPQITSLSGGFGPSARSAYGTGSSWYSSPTSYGARY